MALIPYPTKEQMAPDVREHIEVFEREHGRPTLVRLMAAHFPPALRAIDAMYHPFMTEGQLDRREKELIFVASCNVRGCFY
jgi:alkylhydroperoxidase/carboxymuconolactone decarboxylase family protein YurZ